MQTDKRFCAAGGKQTRCSGDSQKVPSNTVTSAAGTALQAALSPELPVGLPCPLSAVPGRPSFRSRSAAGKVVCAREAQRGDRRRGKEGTWGGLTLRISLSCRWHGQAWLRRRKPTPSWEGTGQVEGEGDGKVKRNVQTGRGREHESLFSWGRQSYGQCLEQGLKCLRGPAHPAACTHLGHLGRAGADPRCAAECGCSTQGLRQDGAWLEKAPPTPKAMRGPASKARVRLRL